MLKEIIEREINKFMDSRDRQNSESLSKASEKVDELMKRVHKLDSELSMELEEAYTQEEVEYQEMYFKEGFITAIKLMNEINSIKSLG